MSNSKRLSPRQQSRLFRQTMPGAAKRTRRRKQTQRRRQASPLTPVRNQGAQTTTSIMVGRRCTRLLFEGSMKSIEASDSAAFSRHRWLGENARKTAQDQPSYDCLRTSGPCSRSGSRSIAEETQERPAIRGHALQGSVQPVPLDGQLLRSIVWPVIGKAIRKSRNLTQPASQPVPHNDDTCEHGLGAVAVAVEESPTIAAASECSSTTGESPMHIERSTPGSPDCS